MIIIFYGQSSRSRQYSGPGNHMEARLLFYVVQNTLRFVFLRGLVRIGFHYTARLPEMRRSRLADSLPIPCTDGWSLAVRPSVVGRNACIVIYHHHCGCHYKGYSVLSFAGCSVSSQQCGWWACPRHVGSAVNSYNHAANNCDVMTLRSGHGNETGLDSRFNDGQYPGGDKETMDDCILIIILCGHCPGLHHYNFPFRFDSSLTFDYIN